MADRFLARWSGLLLGAIVLVAMAWLALTDQLTLYMHPRYVLFTVIMLGVGAVLAIAAALLLPGRPLEHEHAHAHGQTDDHAHGTGSDAPPSGEAPPRRRTLAVVGSVVTAVAAIALLLAVPPRTLTAGTAETRSVTSSASVSSSSIDAQALEVGADYSTLTISDWVTLLHQTGDPAFYADKRPSVLGFVSPDPSDPENVFYVSRFLVTCCTVDAQALGLPVYAPGWQSSYEAGQWLQVDGSFAANPSTSSTEALVIVPESLVESEEPEDPYVF